MRHWKETFRDCTFYESWQCCNLLGTIWVEAATPTEAMQIADCQDTEDIDWCDEWAVTDCEEDECPELHDYKRV